MKTSNKVHSFLLSQQEGQTILTAKDYPWSVLQVIPTTPENFDRTVTALKKRGMVACHDTDRTFCIIHLASGDHDGQHPERHIAVTQDNHKQIVEDLKDTMAQAAVWYKKVDKCAKLKKYALNIYLCVIYLVVLEIRTTFASDNSNQ